jgi:AraC-like DNA-binding protein
MRYKEFKPEKILKAYIDAYWILETDSLYKPATRRIFADGCTEIFINIGNSTPYVNSVTPLRPCRIYLGGTMTSSSIVTSVPNSSFAGIRFKPAGFSAFYHLPLDKIVDRIIEFPDKELIKLIDLDEELPIRLDKFFLAKIKPDLSAILPITGAIEQHKGLVTVDFIAKDQHLSHRTLERIFNRDLGIPPKEFIKIIRFQHASKKVKMARSQESLLRIAYETGYYDHAHLTREFKRYSGLNPSEMR